MESEDDMYNNYEDCYANDEYYNENDDDDDDDNNGNDQDEHIVADEQDCGSASASTSKLDDSNYDQDYYDNNENDEDNNEDEHSVADVQDYASASTSNHKKTYTVLKEGDILKRQELEISEVFSILSIPEVAVSKLLCKYKWNIFRLYDEWFEDEQKVREQVGLPNPKKLVKCGICFDDLHVQEIYPMACGHAYCRECWKCYITESIDNGPGCLLLTCPEPSCGVAVCRDMVDDLVTEEKKKKYVHYFLRSYVEGSKKIKWCPAPGCKNAVELELGNENFDVTCLCSWTFCWKCVEEGHHPVKCDTVTKWLKKNSSESETTKWIRDNTKSCPNCNRSIEKKIRGCMHMTCPPPCNFQFCWLCLGDWKTHSSKTEGNFMCNMYEDGKKEGLYDKEERITNTAKNNPDKYTHYYERWVFNQKSKEKAIKDLKKIQTVSLSKLSNMTKETETQLQFITDAWKQIINGRRLLKWTYVYGYYFPEDKHDEKQYFEYSQGDAEAILERLHKYAEEGLNVFLGEDTEPPAEANFGYFRQKLVTLTVATRSCFSALVKVLEEQKVRLVYCI